MRDILPTFHLPRCGTINPLPADARDHLDDDPRGLIKLFEPPRRNARYVMGIDATAGLINWTRQHRNDDDLVVDNGAIEIIRCGNGHTTPDIQVAEFAAPIDPDDLADVAALLGRMYCGNSESGEALAIIEIWPGPGLLTQRRLINHYGYSNLFQQEYLNSPVPKITNSFGWESNVKTLQYLWSNGSKHLGRRLCTIKSRWLMDELADLRNEPGKTFPQPTGEQAHDDRVRALFMSIWASHNWSLGQDQQQPTKIQNDEAGINPQASDMSEMDYHDWAEERFQSLLNDH